MSGEHQDRALVIVLDGGYESYAQEEQMLQAAGYAFARFEGGRHDRAAKLDFARDAAGIFIRWSELDAATFDALPNLRCVVRYGAGYDNVDLEAATRRGVKVSNVQGYANEAVSDHTLALILSCVRALPLGARQLREHYAAPPRRHMPELKDMTLGIVGLGRIGGALCRKARRLFQRVLACDPYIPRPRFQELGALETPFAVLLRESDVVSIHCNLTEETTHLFDRSTFAKMRSTAILINTARGPVVDEEALLDALNAGTLHAAGLDVFHDEPPLANRDALVAHPQVVATGHYAWYSNASHRELQRRAAQNMIAMLGGEYPEDCLNARELQQRS